MKRAKFITSRRSFGRQVCSLAAWLAICLTGAAGIATPRSATAAPCSALPRPQDQLWLVSDRSLGCADVAAGGANLRFWRYEPGQGWQGADAASFFAADDPATITHIWIHGNRISHSYAFQVGWIAYSAFVRQTADERPLRFVIWSWPSDRIDGGQLEDVRVKAARTGASALHLARFIDLLPADLPVSISAYSFGARIATGALHAVAGGVIDGRRLSMSTAATRPRLDVILIAAALDNDWILPGHCHGRALSMMNRLLLVTNSCDQVLSRYRLLYGLRSCAQALGCTGLVGGNQLGADRAKITQFDACCLVGSEHDWSHYFCSPAVVARMVTFMFPVQWPTFSQRPTASEQPAPSSPVALNAPAN